mgnify:CR=1 FL=1|jgi:hypothetical protein
MKRYTMLAGALIGITTGCAYFTPPLQRPVIEEKLNRATFNAADIGTLSLTPERRVVLVHFENKKFCAEAPTEIGIDVASAIKAGIKGNTATQTAVEAALESALNNQNSVLNRRTQGVQLFLANSYFLCQMYMNEVLDKNELYEAHKAALAQIIPLIEKELALLPKIAEQENKRLSSLPTPTILDENP